MKGGGKKALETKKELGEQEQELSEVLFGEGGGVTFAARSKSSEPKKSIKKCINLQ